MSSSNLLANYPVTVDAQAVWHYYSAESVSRSVTDSMLRRSPQNYLDHRMAGNPYLPCMYSPLEEFFIPFQITSFRVSKNRALAKSGAVGERTDIVMASGIRSRGKRGSWST